MSATRRFADWCASKEIHELTQVEPFHVAAFVHDLQDGLSPPSVKQHLAAIRMLFDWLVTGHVIETNPAHSVRGPRYTVKKGKRPVLTPEEAHALLEGIPKTKKRANDAEAADQPDLLGLRDRALIAMMVYSFARIGAVIQMEVGDYFVQGRRRWIRLHEKGGKGARPSLPSSPRSVPARLYRSGRRHRRYRHLPRDRHHRLAKEGRQVGSGAADR
jgi:site-specific recombinase XerD